MRRVFEELRREAPDGIRYATFRLEDGVTFVHLASVAAAEGNPLLETHAFQEFQAGLGDRRETPPEVTDLVEVGSYRVFGG